MRRLLFRCTPPDTRPPMRPTLIASVVLLLAFPFASAQPTSQPTANLTIHVTSRPALSPEASAWLDKIDAASQQLKTFQADVIYDREQGLMGDKQTRAGRLVYLTGPPAQFAIRFDKRFIGKRMEPLD